MGNKWETVRNKVGDRQETSCKWESTHSRRRRSDQGEEGEVGDISGLKARLKVSGIPVPFRLCRKARHATDTEIEPQALGILVPPTWYHSYPAGNHQPQDPHQQVAWRLRSP